MTSSWELGFAPAEQIQPADTESTACFFPLIACKLLNLPYSSASLCLLRTANQVHARKIDRGHMWISSFWRDRRARKEQEVKGNLCPFQRASASLTSEMAFLFTSWPCLYYVSIFCIPGPSVSYRHLKLCSVKAGYCQCSMSRSKKYWQRVWLNWVPQPSCCNRLGLCFCKTWCQRSDMEKGKQLL